jgi:hypothetical protein
MNLFEALLHFNSRSHAAVEGGLGWFCEGSLE